MSARQVWKYPVPFGDVPIRLMVPKDGIIVHFDVQRVDTVWVEVNPESPERLCVLQWFGTGHPLPEGASHVGTVIRGNFVWHLYKLKDQAA